MHAALGSPLRGVAPTSLGQLPGARILMSLVQLLQRRTVLLGAILLLPREILRRRDGMHALEEGTSHPLRSLYPGIVGGSR